MTKLFCFLTFLITTNAVAQETIHLAPGHQKVISIAGVKRAAIGNPSVADVKVLSNSNQVMVTGVSIGTTDLILWISEKIKKNYSIVVGTHARDLSEEVGLLLRGIEGVELRSLGGRWVLDGQIYRGEDLTRVHQVLAMYPMITDLTRVNGASLSYIATELNRVLQQAGFESITARPGGNKLFLEGTAPGKSEAARADQIAKSFYSNLSNHVVTGFSEESMTLVDVKLMEVKTNSLGQIGLSWPPSISGTGSTTWASGGGFASTFTVGQGATLSLNALIEKGAAKILSNPKLLCRSGTPASFLAGGSIPIRLVGERTASVTFKEYGVGLEITTRVDRGQRVFLEIESKISDLDSASAVDGIPGLLEHRVKTAADLRYGDTVVLGGLLENRSRKNVQKVPFLGHIPILGELFKSRDFQQNQSEFLVFMTPLPADSKNPVAGQAIRQIQKKNEAVSKEIDLSILD